MKICDNRAFMWKIYVVQSRLAPQSFLQGEVCFVRGWRERGGFRGVTARIRGGCSNDDVC